MVVDLLLDQDESLIVKMAVFSPNSNLQIIIHEAYEPEVWNAIISFACFGSAYALGDETEDCNGRNEQHEIVELDTNRIH